jgi:hypothetical protein
MSIENVLNPHLLEIYISYNRLTARSLGKLISGLASLSDLSVKMYADAVKLEIPELPTLEVEVVKTGDSIKFTFGEGWIPSITNDESHDIIINIPRKIGIPILIGYLLLISTKMAFDVHNAYLDSKLKKIDILLKESEMRKVLEKKKNIPMLSEESINIVNIIVQNNDYKEFKVYGVDIIGCYSHNKNKDK